MLIRHPRIYLAADGRSTNALLVRNHQVVATGDDASSAATAADEVVEPDGACLFPALADAHVHLWGLGLRQGSVSLGAARSTADLYDTLRRYDLADAPQGWALGRDWDQHDWADGDELDLATLDAIFPNNPLVLRRIDGHSLWVNSEALRRAGITATFSPGPNGHAGRDPSGRLNGLLVDDAMDPVLDTMPEPTEDEDRAVFLDSCARLRSFGIASAHVAWMPVDRLPMLEALAREGALPLRLHLLLDGRDDALDDVLARGPRHDEWLAVRGVKFFADGAMGSRGAHLHGTYRDGTRGLVLEPPHELASRCAALARDGWQVAVHAIGDAAATTVLDAFEAMAPADRRATRPRMEHAQMVGPRDCQRFGELGVVASIQPIHMHSDAAWLDEELDDRQLDDLFPWRRLADAAPIVCGGSDYPIEDPNPWHAIATAITRRDRTGRTFRPDQALSRTEALGAYTDGAARAAHWEGRLGALDVGHLADFCALDRDPFRCDTDELWDMQCLMLRTGSVNGGE